MYPIKFSLISTAAQNFSTNCSDYASNQICPYIYYCTRHSNKMFTGCSLVNHICPYIYCSVAQDIQTNCTHDVPNQMSPDIKYNMSL